MVTQPSPDARTRAAIMPVLFALVTALAALRHWRVRVAAAAVSATDPALNGINQVATVQVQ